MSTPDEGDGGHHVIPPDELKCVWMSAGILSYQLCDRQLECDQCPLDQAMRTFTRRGVRSDEAASPHETFCAPRDRHLRDDRLYSREFCWVMRREDVPDDGARVRIGLAPALALALLTPRAVVHVEPGAPVGRGGTHLWIVTEGGTFGVRAPLDGTLREVNPLLHDRPHLVAARPLDEGWLVELGTDPRAKDYQRLETATAAALAYEAADARLREMLRHALRGHLPKQKAHGDEAAQFRGFAEALGPARYLTLVRRVYG